MKNIKKFPIIKGHREEKNIRVCMLVHFPIPVHQSIAQNENFFFKYELPKAILLVVFALDYLREFEHETEKFLRVR